MTEREPGFYWVCNGDDWEPQEWTGSKWWGIASQRGFTQMEMDEMGYTIGERLVHE